MRIFAAVAALGIVLGKPAFPIWTKMKNLVEKNGDILPTASNFNGCLDLTEDAGQKTCLDATAGILEEWGKVKWEDGV